MSPDASPRTPWLSVVIPTWCEVAEVADAVACAARVGDEVIVADGGSPDGTGERAARAGARVVLAPRGRGAQLHAGACAARGEVLLFLHADSRLGPEARAAMEAVLADPVLLGGNFRLRFVPESPAARAFSRLYNTSARLLRVHYGDSALFLRRSAYAALGGFRPLPLFEDYELTRRLRRHGPTVQVRRCEVTSSARRFVRHPWRTLGQWLLLQTLYSVGVPAEQLARWYAPVRTRSASGEGA